MEKLEAQVGAVPAAPRVVPAARRPAESSGSLIRSRRSWVSCAGAPIIIGAIILFVVGAVVVVIPRWLRSAGAR